VPGVTHVPATHESPLGQSPSGEHGSSPGGVGR
jgi:hypothetical protein